MKKTLLLLSLFATSLSFAQNVDDQKVTINYIQLPLAPIQGTAVYSVEVDHSVYQKNNEDSLTIFEGKLALAESQLVTWIEQKKKIDQAHRLELAKWEKLVNAGTPATEPKKPAYPEMPVLKEELPEPILTQEISESLVGNGVVLDGFSKGEGGSVIKVKFDGIQNARIEMTKTGSGATTKYKYVAKYKFPYHITIESPGQGVLYNYSEFGEKTKTVETFDSQYNFEYWKADNINAFWKTVQTEALNAAITDIKSRSNNYCGFPLKSYATEIYTVKKYKEHNYSDFIDGYAKTKGGYDKIAQDKNRMACISDIKAGIATWEAALAESNPADKKSRVNEKVTALLYANLAEAYMWINDWSKAELYIQKAKAGGVLKYKKHGKRLEEKLKDLKRRYMANS